MLRECSTKFPCAMSSLVLPCLEDLPWMSLVRKLFNIFEQICEKRVEPNHATFVHAKSKARIITLCEFITFANQNPQSQYSQNQLHEPHVDCSCANMCNEMMELVMKYTPFNSCRKNPHRTQNYLNFNKSTRDRTNLLNNSITKASHVRSEEHQ